MNAEKAEMGRKAWEQMAADGIIERIKPGMNTDWSSALHLAPKPGGGVRPCTDFRALNKLTVTDAHPLPLLRDFTSKLAGSTHFSKVDLRSAFLIFRSYQNISTKRLPCHPGEEVGSTTAWPSVWPLGPPPGRSFLKRFSRT